MTSIQRACRGTTTPNAAQREGDGGFSSKQSTCTRLFRSKIPPQALMRCASSSHFGVWSWKKNKVIIIIKKQRGSYVEKKVCVVLRSKMALSTHDCDPRRLSTPTNNWKRNINIFVCFTIIAPPHTRRYRHSQASYIFSSYFCQPARVSPTFATWIHAASPRRYKHGDKWAYVSPRTQGSCESLWF